MSHCQGTRGPIMVDGCGIAESLVTSQCFQLNDAKKSSAEFFLLNELNSEPELDRLETLGT